MNRACEMCPPGAQQDASLYCDADACYLCSACDEEVHGANRLAGRHLRRRLADLPPTPPTSVASSTSFDADLSLPTLDDACAALFADTPDYDFADMQLALDSDTFFTRSSPACALSWEAVFGAALEPLSPDPAPAPVRRVKSEPALAARAVTPQPPASPMSASTEPSRASPPRTSAPPLQPPSTDDILSVEQRRQLRLKALARFRSKRASRSFAKKVRYECRKQLADSRPRVKGRFVKKSEMALYHKYGALYRNYMHELTDRPAS